MKKYPANQGWLVARVKGKNLTKNEVLNLLCVGKVESYEIAEYTEYKTLIKVIYRKKK